MGQGKECAARKEAVGGQGRACRGRRSRGVEGTGVRAEEGRRVSREPSRSRESWDRDLGAGRQRLLDEELREHGQAVRSYTETTRSEKVPGRLLG